jgi:lysylphosphatidylglycerol synthetase-like protein (DUF2156 family)
MMFRLLAAIFFILGAVFALVDGVAIEQMFFLFAGLAAWVLSGGPYERNL